jgi:hypothetical protein
VLPADRCFYLPRAAVIAYVVSLRFRRDRQLTLSGKLAVWRSVQLQGRIYCLVVIQLSWSILTCLARQSEILVCSAIGLKVSIWTLWFKTRRVPSWVRCPLYIYIYIYIYILFSRLQCRCKATQKWSFICEYVFGVDTSFWQDLLCYSLHFLKHSQRNNRRGQWKQNSSSWFLYYLNCMAYGNWWQWRKICVDSFVDSVVLISARLLVIFFTVTNTEENRCKAFSVMFKISS